MKAIRILQNHADAELNQHCAVSAGPYLEAIDELKKLQEFARKTIRHICWNEPTLDGGTLQDLSEKLGLIEPCKATEKDVDPEFDDFEVGDTIYKFTDILKGGG